MHLRKDLTVPALFILPVLLIAVACGPKLSPVEKKQTEELQSAGPTKAAAVTATLPVEGIPSVAPSPQPPQNTPTPTPRFSRPVDSYVVAEGDSLFWIAQNHGCTVDDLIALNDLEDPGSLQVGQWLWFPVEVERVGPDTKLMPDSEMVYGPSYVDFDLDAFVEEHPGYLKGYREKVNGKEMSGAQIIRLVAERFSVGLRPMLALLEYRSGWLSNPTPAQQALDYPMGLHDRSRVGLLRQASWAADRFNQGYYGRLRSDLFVINFSDRKKALFASGLNPGTAGVQNVLALQTDWEQWNVDIGPEGYMKTYRELFGDPAQYAIEPLIPPDLAQPPLDLPWPKGETWYYSSGPHPAWMDGSAWAALDFLPPGEGVGCWDSDSWVTAPGPGVVLRVEEGVALQDLDGASPADGLEQTGWVLFYLHLATEGKAEPGARLKTGDQVGHPSCEGGQATGSHLHLARRYNGQWMDASGQVPAILSGWTVKPALAPYKGDMVKGGMTRTAGEFRESGINDLPNE